MGEGPKPMVLATGPSSPRYKWDTAHDNNRWPTPEFDLDELKRLYQEAEDRFPSKAELKSWNSTQCRKFITDLEVFEKGTELIEGLNTAVKGQAEANPYFADQCNEMSIADRKTNDECLELDFWKIMMATFFTKESLKARFN